jgi:carbamoyltransferase
MSVILGISAFHPDTSACVVIDGVLQAAVAEERLGERAKHSAKFPVNAIRQVLKQSGVRLKDLTHLAVARNENVNLSAKFRHVLKHPVQSTLYVKAHLSTRVGTGSLRAMLPEVLGCDPQDALFQIVKVEHHLAHVASAYYLSPFDTLAAGISYDGSGDFATVMVARCEGTNIRVLDRVLVPDSLGFFYTSVCQFIGFDGFGEEYKVMGLAPYGENSYGDLMKDILAMNGRWFSLNRKYIGMENWERAADGAAGRMGVPIGYTGRLTERLGPPRKREEPITKREKDIARSCQARFEEVAIHCVNQLFNLVPSKNLVMAGGCALNGVTNARILRDTSFENQYLQCAASDDGTSLGAAYYCWHNVVGGKERFQMTHAFWGPEYCEEHLGRVAQSCGMPFTHHRGEALLGVVAGHLTEGEIVGWYQGKSEWGPRALGNRSILADPTRADMKDVLNAKIKRRESFRPFAPSVLREEVGKYFEQDIESPFMMHVVKIRPAWRDKLPAVTHVDGTGRLQSVSQDNNPKYYALIDKFRQKTGVGILLNTSFNENEPIVDTPEQALACFLRTDMDVLCLGDYVITKRSMSKGPIEA